MKLRNIVENRHVYIFMEDCDMEFFFDTIYNEIYIMLRHSGTRKRNNDEKKIVINTSILS